MSHLCECGKYFRDREIQVHIKEYFSGDNVLYCYRCEKKSHFSSSKNGLLSHIGSLHLKKRKSFSL